MKFEFSAGGIVVRRGTTPLRQGFEGQAQNNIEVLLAQHGGHHGWVFPKGLIDELRTRKETKEEAAVREVEEETGVLAQLGKPLTPITYWYQMDGEKRKKTVYYFLMEFVSEDLSKKDDEMENVEWVPIDEVEKKLTYESDKEVWKQAREIISSQ